jgi:two-component system sensor histidine kinase UhpB
MLERLERERLGARRQALAAQEEERARIARELHDEIGQTLTAIALEAERPRDGTLNGSGARIGQWAERALDDLRRIARELRPEALDDLGLVNALIALCTRVAEQSGLDIERQLEGHAPSHAPELDLVIYRVAQESLTNVVRHADASRVIVAFGSEGDRLRLRISDDGRGIGDAAGSTNGIAGMRERAALVGGRLEITRGELGGTAVCLDVPLKAGVA